MRRGFTLVELMMVVAIVGILGVVAYVGYSHYVASSKSAEARNALAAIAKDAASQFDRERGANVPVFSGQTSGNVKQLCASATTTVPASLASVSGKKYQSAKAEWQADAASNAGFACLGFAMDQPQYYMYGYRASGTGLIGDTFTAMAMGDLAGTGKSTSTFSITGAVGTGMVVNVAPNIATSCTATGNATCPDL